MQDPGTTQPEGNSSIHLNYKFIIFLILKNFQVLVVNSLCTNIFFIYLFIFSKFAMLSLSGEMDFRIPCAVATLWVWNP